MNDSLDSAAGSRPGDALRGQPGAAWSGLWRLLTRDLAPACEGPLALALSGGADSLFLLHVLAEAQPRPQFFALHVDHGLRGAASRADAESCRRQCAALEVACEIVELDLDLEPLTGTRGQEARGRAARYAALLAAARARGARTLLTAHHADDALETLLMRLARGARLGAVGGLCRSLVVTQSNLPGLEPDAPVDTRSGAPPRAGALAPISVLRPLLEWRAADIRAALAARGIAWREDASNRDLRFTRARARHTALPLFAELAGPELLDNLRAFGAAVTALEDEIAARLVPLSWKPPPFARLAGAAGAGAGAGALRGGWIASEEIARLPRALWPRALGRLVLLGSGRAARAKVLQQAAEALERGERARFALPGGYGLALSRGVLTLLPPPEREPREHTRAVLQARIDPGGSPGVPAARALPGATSPARRRRREARPGGD